MDLVIDGNAFLNVALSVVKGSNQRDNRSEETYYVNDIFNDTYILKEHVKVGFRNFCFNYFTSLITPIGPFLESVHIVFDSKSWRKEYTKNFFNDSDFKTTSAPDEFNYKGNRKYYDYQYLFFDYFQKILMPKFIDECGVNEYVVNGAEGDDIIAYLCDSIKGDIMIYTVDQDIKQKVSNSSRNIIVIVPKQMSKHKKVFIPETFNPELAEEEEDNFFSLNESHITGSKIDKIIENLVKKDYVEYRVDPIEEVFQKILRGDKSDNISKINSITPTKARKIIDAINLQFGETSLDLLDNFDESLFNFILSQIETLNKIKESDKLEEIRKHLIFNTRIIRLSVKVFPEEIQDNLEEFFNGYRVTRFKSKEYQRLKNNQSLI
jgi:hypothetical protein